MQLLTGVDFSSSRKLCRVLDCFSSKEVSLMMNTRGAVLFVLLTCRPLEASMLGRSASCAPGPGVGGPGERSVIPERRRKKPKSKQKRNNK
jgi:hypothetical protein